jgi:hypothetical protein
MDQPTPFHSRGVSMPPTVGKDDRQPRRICHMKPFCWINHDQQGIHLQRWHSQDHCRHHQFPLHKSLSANGSMIEANTLQDNESLQQLANNNAQLQHQQQAMMQQMGILSTNAAAMPCNNQYIQPPTQIYAPTLQQGFQQYY